GCTVQSAVDNSIGTPLPPRFVDEAMGSRASSRGQTSGGRAASRRNPGGDPLGATLVTELTIMNEYRFTAEVARHARDAKAARELWGSATVSLKERVYPTPG